ncbi:aldo/keto reductase [Glutamicibacter mysorens]
MTELAPLRELNNGSQMPSVGVGTWPYVGKECRRIVAQALDIGYRLIDTSHKYGNEEEVGKAIRESGVPRGEIFVTSKFNKEDQSFDGVHRAYEESLRRTGLDYLDLFLIHWPVPWLDQYVAAWEGLVDLVQSGRVGSIGVSNFKPAHLQRIIEATGYVPAVNQIQLSVDIARMEPRLFHNKLGIITEGWSPLGRGPELRENPTVMRIAEEIGRSPAQILLRWHVQSNIVPVPRADSTQYLTENLNLFDFSLTDGQMADLLQLDRGESAARDSDDPINGH